MFKASGHQFWATLGSILSGSAATTHSFPMHSHTERDLPAFVDFVLENTGHERLAYIGHSQVIGKGVVRHMFVLARFHNCAVPRDIHKTPATTVSTVPAHAREPRK